MIHDPCRLNVEKKPLLRTERVPPGKEPVSAGAGRAGEMGKEPVSVGSG